MAAYNEILAGRFNRALQKMLSMKGDPPSPTLAGEIAAIHAFMSGVENRYLEGWQRYAGTSGNAGVAAQVGQFRLRNPSTSNVIAVLEKLTVTNPGAAVDAYTVFEQPLANDLATVFGNLGARLDARGSQTPTLIQSGTEAASAGLVQTKLSVQLPVNATYDFITYENQEIVILPGDAVHVETSVANNSSRCSFMWRERALEESERT